MRIEFGEWREFLDELKANHDDGGSIVNRIVRYRIVYDRFNNDLPDCTVGLVLSALVADADGGNSLLEFAAIVGEDAAASPMWRDLVTDFSKIDQAQAQEMPPLTDSEDELILDEITGNHPVFLDPRLTGTAAALLIIREFYRFAAENQSKRESLIGVPLFRMRAGKIELY